MARWTYKVLSRHVRIYRNDVYVGDMRYSPEKIGWVFVSKDGKMDSEAFDTYLDAFNHLKNKFQLTA